MSSSLEQIVRDYIVKISKKRGFHTEYDLVISNAENLTASEDGRLIDIIIQAGNPVKIIVPMLFIARTLLAEKPNVILFRDRLERGLEKLPILLRTLSNPIPRDRAIILYQDAKRWIKTRTDVERFIPDNYFEVEYMATVTDKITGMSFTAAGETPKEAEDKAKARLSKIILNNKSLHSFRVMLQDMQKPVEKTPEVSEITFTSKLDSNEVKETIKYDNQ